jgi:hypothetical protein
VGFSTHSGWAVAITCSLGAGGRLAVLDRRRAQLIGAGLPRQPYHAAEGLSPEEGDAIVSEVTTAIAESSRAFLDELAGLSITAVAVVGRPREVPDVATVLASHARMHATEGELYRQGLVEAADALGLAAHRCDPDALPNPADFEAEWKAVRAVLGPPWAKDHKLAYLAARASLT